MYFSKFGCLLITDWEIFISPPAKRQTMFHQAQWLLQMNMLLSNQISKPDEWTCDGNFCFKFFILFSKCFCHEFVLHLSDLSLHFHLFRASFTIILYVYCTEAMQDDCLRKNRWSLNSQLWCSLVPIITVVWWLDLKGPLGGQCLRRVPQSSLWQTVHECPNKSAWDTIEEMELQAAEAAHHLYCLLRSLDDRVVI